MSVWNTERHRIPPPPHLIHHWPFFDVESWSLNHGRFPHDGRNPPCSGCDIGNSNPLAHSRIHSRVSGGRIREVRYIGIRCHGSRESCLSWIGKKASRTRADGQPKQANQRGVRRDPQSNTRTTRDTVVSPSSSIPLPPWKKDVLLLPCDKAIERTTIFFGEPATFGLW